MAVRISLGDTFPGYPTEPVDPAEVYWTFVVQDFVVNPDIVWVSPQAPAAAGSTIVLRSNTTSHEIEITGSFRFQAGNPSSVTGTVTGIKVTDATDALILQGAGLNFTWAFLTDEEQTLADVQGVFRSLGGRWDGTPLDDVLYGAGGNDELYGNAGDDQLTGNAGNDKLFGAVGDDNLNGGPGDDMLSGGPGADLLNGDTGTDSMSGGAGDDIYWVDRTSDRVSEAADEGVDTVRSSITYTLGAVTLENLELIGIQAINGTGNALDNTIFGNSANNILSGGAGNDELHGEGGNDTLDGGAGADALHGGAGDDTYLLDIATDTIVEAADGGTDTIRIVVTPAIAGGTLDLNAYANVENVVLLGSGAFTVIGNAGNNNLTGNASANTLTGGLGNDVLNGAGGNDTMSGGLGDDTYYVDSTADTVIEMPLQGNQDTVRSTLGYTLGANLENLILIGTAAISGTGNDAINTLVGNDGANVLDGRGGADTMAGGKGNDTYIVDSAGDTVTESVLGGMDLVKSSVSFTLTAEVENLTLLGDPASDLDGIGNLAANTITGDDGDNELSGLGGNDRLIGNAGDDTLDGGLGDDVMAGGAGSDTYWVDSLRDVVSETLAGPAGGVDLVRASVSYTLGANVDNLTLLGSLALAGAGNALDNTIVGNSGSNQLLGLAGSDTLRGEAGDDRLDGGTGNDVLRGGAGNDWGYLDTPEDTMLEDPGEGTSDAVLLFYPNRAAAPVVIDLSSPQYANIEWIGVFGTGLFDVLGSAADNLLQGSAAANVMDGLDGLDTLLGLGGNDTLRGGAGDDNVDGGAGADRLEGGAGNDEVNGGAGADWLEGGDGHDELDGGVGADRLEGGAGDDIYYLDSAGDVILVDPEGRDIVWSSVFFSLEARPDLEVLALLGNAALSLIGNAGDNSLQGNAAPNLLDGRGGADRLYGLGGNDTYIVDDVADVVDESQQNASGVDLIKSSVSFTLPGGIENLTLTGDDNLEGMGNSLANVITGTRGNNKLSGLAGNDRLVGDLGNDVLLGGAGDDVMIGGAGDDEYEVDSAKDVVTETLAGAAGGTDLVKSSVGFVLAATLENLTLTGSANVNGTGNAARNELTGNTGNNVLTGGAGDDLLTGAAGDDRLIGGAGLDTMTGGAGNDTYDLDSEAEVVRVTEAAIGGGIDTVRLAYGNATATPKVIDLASVFPNFENVTLLGTGLFNITGTSDNNVLVGNASVNVLLGGAGDDVLDGGLHNDIMTGGTGSDAYHVNSTADVTTELENEGIDTIVATFSYSLLWDRADNIENLTLSGTAAINGTGDEGDNVITGNAAANGLDGGAGNDTLDGGAGADRLIGGAGDDTYVADNARDLVVETDAAGGTDTVQASVTYTLAVNVENVLLLGTAAINGTGNALANALTGNGADNLLSGLGGADTLRGGAGNDVLDGGAGTDTLIGGTGDDTYVVDDVLDVVTETSEAGSGNELVRIGYSADPGAVLEIDLGTRYSNVERLVILGTGPINVTGTDLANELTGNAQVNILRGGGGNDILDGGAGNDGLEGGAGDDTYVVDRADDVVIEAAGAGNDLVRVAYSNPSASAALSIDLTTNYANVERLTITGTGRFDATGSAADNVLTGNASVNALNGQSGNDTLVGNAGNDSLQGGDGNDILDGGSGVDNMAGGAGNDIYYVDTAADVTTEAAGGGDDKVISTVTFSLTSPKGANIEHLTLAGSAAINGTGSDAANTLIGNGAANVLDAGAGNDTLQGEGGNDTLRGGAGNDLLNGGAGSDTMTGGAGDDTYEVDVETDRVIEAADQGNDTVRLGYANPDANKVVSIVLATRYANVENLVVLGTGRFNVTGTDADNTLTGNASDNVLSGGAGNDTLLGGAGVDTLAGGTGVDTMTGGAGNDSYDVDSVNDQVVEDAATGSGTDLVRLLYSNASQTVQVINIGSKYANVENLTLLGTGLFDVTGTTAANQLTGNASANTLDGGSGNDTLSGGDGNDTLLGGAGDDTLLGGAGVDTMTGGTGNDTYNLDSASDGVTELAAEGTDTVRLQYGNPDATAVAIDLATKFPNVESVTLLGTGLFDVTGTNAANVLTGNASPNTLIGLDGNDTLTGGGGIDTMAGGAGDDIYDVDAPGDIVTEAAGAGNDQVRLGYENEASTPVAIDLATAFPNVEKLTILGAGRFDVIGTDASNELTGNGSANVLDGGAGNDTLAGGAGDDTLVGGTGDDTLNGGSGNDTMRGGAGNDTYNVDSVSDVTDEAGGSGTDTVLASLTFSLASVGAAGIENLTLAGTSAIDGTGNGANNALTGNAAANVLAGGEGDDTLIGKAGSDTLAGGAGADLFQFDTALGPSNVDTIQDFNPDADLLFLDVTIFAAGGPFGALSPTRFRSGDGVTTAGDADDRFIYNTSTGTGGGALYYDADGTGTAAAPVQFATLTGSPALTASDFFLADL